MEQDSTGEYPHPKYLGVTLDRTLSYREHIHNAKMKVATRCNLLRKLPNSKCGANASTIGTTTLALCYSVAEYAAVDWARSSHAQKLNPELNSACRAVTGCLKTTNVEDLYLLAGIAPPDIQSVSALDFNFERAVKGSILTAGKRLSETLFVIIRAIN